MPSLDTIKFNGEDIELKKKLTFGEVRTFQKIAGNLIGMDERIKLADEEQLGRLAEETLKSTDEQMDLVSNTIMNCLGFTQKQVDVLSFPEAIVLFNEVFSSSTQVKKKLEQPYG